jgi:hypothetical protein
VRGPHYGEVFGHLVELSKLSVNVTARIDYVADKLDAAGKRDAYIFYEEAVSSQPTVLIDLIGRWVAVE